MKTQQGFYLLKWFFVFTLLIPACAPTGISSTPASVTAATTPPTTVPTAPRPPGHLETALSLIPENTELFSFTDWSLIKKYKNQEKLNGQSSMEDKVAFLLSTTKDQAAASCQSCQYIQLFWDNWGWDTLDLEWEASSGMTTLAQFRDDFDLAIIEKKFEERGFSKTEYQGVPVYTHKLDASQDWMHLSLPILNTAVLSRQNILIMSSIPGNLNAVLDVYAGKAGAFGNDSAVKSLVGAIGEMASMKILPGKTSCIFPGVQGGAMTPEQVQTQEANSKWLEQQGLKKYQAFSLGYRYDANQLSAFIGFSYADAATAQADLEGRRKVMAEGISLVWRKPYRTSLFIVVEANVIDNVLLIKVDPLNSLPRRLFTAVDSRDLGFAACP